MRDSTENVAVSQDAKTLVPLSLSLVAKKEKILQMEVTKLEKLISHRNEMLSGLQRGHEYLLMTNGQLQERRRLHGETLVSLMTSLGVHQGVIVTDEGHLSDAIGLNELDATAEKCGVLKAILVGLAEKHAGLEQQCMGLEDQSSRVAFTLDVKMEKLNEARATSCLIREDIHSTQWNIERDQAELAEIEKRLHVVRQSAQHDAVEVENLHTTLRNQRAAAEDLHINWRNFQDMVHEEHRQLAIANEVATSKQRELQMLLASNGATCPADTEVQEFAENLQLQLQRVNEEMTGATFYNRELALREKQEKQWLTFAQLSIKAKDDQLAWLNRHREHLENEQKEVEKAYADEEAAYQATLKEHKAALISLDKQIKDAGKHLKTTNRTISALDKKVAALNKKIAPQEQVLVESKAKIHAQQEQLAKLTATKELVVAKVLAMQNTLKQALLNVQTSQQLEATKEMESEELRSSCMALENEIQEIQKTLVTLENEFATAQTAVKNKVDEVRDKFLSTFVIDDAKNLIQLLNKEFANSPKDSNKFDNSIASQEKMLKQRYDKIMACTRKKYDKILQQKTSKSQKRQYNAKLNMLETQAAEKREKLTDDSIQGKADCTDKDILRKKTDSEAPLSATSKEDPKPNDYSEVLAAENGGGKNQPENQEFDSPRPRCNDTSAAEVSKTGKYLSKVTQRETQRAQKLVTRSARRQLVPGCNPEDKSPQTDNELIDNSTTVSGIVEKEAEPDHAITRQQRRRSNASVARQPRLKRRTPAQKAGKIAKSSAGTASCATQNPTPEIVTQDSFESPVGCDDAIEVSQSALVKQRTETAALSTATKLSQSHQQISAQNQNTVKRNRTGKAPHRNRRTKVKKVSRTSLVRVQAGSRTVDWSAADSFSFD